MMFTQNSAINKTNSIARRFKTTSHITINLRSKYEVSVWRQLKGQMLIKYVDTQKSKHITFQLSTLIKLSTSPSCQSVEYLISYNEVQLCTRFQVYVSSISRDIVLISLGIVK